METAKVQINGVHAKTVYCSAIPRGIVGARVALEYVDDLWDGLTKNVVFSDGQHVVPVRDVGASVEIPPAVVDTVGAELRVGVCGISADGAVIIPTLWASLGTVKNAVPTSLSDEEHADPGHPVWMKVEEEIGDLDELKTKDKSSLVAAVNEVFEGLPDEAGAGIDITGAAVGQIVRIAAVDENGVPTAWEPVDLPSGGGEWALIEESTLTEDVVEYKSGYIGSSTEIRIDFEGRINDAENTLTSGNGKVLIRVGSVYSNVYNDSFSMHRTETTSFTCVIIKKQTDDITTCQVFNSVATSGTFANKEVTTKAGHATFPCQYILLKNMTSGEYFKSGSTIRIYGR